MLLAIDVGNTNIKYGIFDGARLAASFRVASHVKKTADEYGAVLLNLLSSKKIGAEEIGGIIVSSVIPSLNYTIVHMCEYFFGKTPMMIGPGVKTGLNIRAENPKEVGADIIVNSVAAFRKYGGPVVLIDFGTATTFDVITAKEELVGCIIAPALPGWWKISWRKSSRSSASPRSPWSPPAAWGKSSRKKFRASRILTEL